MSSETPEPQEEVATPKKENKFLEYALAEFDNYERDPGVWAIVCVESAENLKPLNLTGEKYTKAFEEASKRLYVKLRANALLKGHTLLTFINRIIWIAVFGLAVLGGVVAYIGGAFEIIINTLSEKLAGRL
jgi:hypothetical protein